MATRLRVRELAEERGMTITNLSRAANIAYDTALEYWHDRPKQFNREVLDKLASALGVRVGDLFSGDPQPPGAASTGQATQEGR
jgi:transcriptional regulator with XRE-family HTH domain